MNVALTRAKSSLFILGNAPTLERSDGTWRQIVEDARSSSSLVDVTIISIKICIVLMLPQVDVNYFAPVASPTPVVVSSLKKKTRTVTAPVPLDLATPQQLKAATAPQPTSSAVHGPIPPIVEAVQGTKRPADTDGASSSVKAPKPEQPRKRQKMQPSLFIPKKRT